MDNPHEDLLGNQLRVGNIVMAAGYVGIVVKLTPKRVKVLGLTTDQLRLPRRQQEMRVGTFKADMLSLAGNILKPNLLMRLIRAHKETV